MELWSITPGRSRDRNRPNPDCGGNVMGIIETYLLTVGVATLATFGFVIRGIQADMLRLQAARAAVNGHKAA